MDVGVVDGGRGLHSECKPSQSRLVFIPSSSCGLASNPIPISAVAKATSTYSFRRPLARSFFCRPATLQVLRLVLRAYLRSRRRRVQNGKRQTKRYARCLSMKMDSLSCDDLSRKVGRRGCGEMARSSSHVKNIFRRHALGAHQDIASILRTT